VRERSIQNPLDSFPGHVPILAIVDRPLHVDAGQPRQDLQASQHCGACGELRRILGFHLPRHVRVAGRTGGSPRDLRLEGTEPATEKASPASGEAKAKIGLEVRAVDVLREAAGGAIACAEGWERQSTIGPCQDEQWRRGVTSEVEARTQSRVRCLLVRRREASRSLAPSLDFAPPHKIAFRGNSSTAHLSR
jgi:hypothetical protein